MSGFSIIGASGNLLRTETWTPTVETGLEVGINERRRTYLDHHHENASYLVVNGNGDDFVRLTDGHGFRVAPNTRLWFRSRVWHAAAATTKAIVIEFDGDGRRLGELAITINNDALVHFRRETRSALLTLRIRGKGRVAFTELQANLEGTTVSEPTPGVQHFKLNTLEHKHTVDTRDLQAQIAGIEDVAHALGEQLSLAENTPASLSASTSIAKPEARDDGPISAARERFVRSMLENMADSLPNTNGSHHFKPLNLTIGIIADESMYNFYRDSCQAVHYLSPDNYHDILSTNTLDAIIYVTCWKGLIADEWRGVKFRDAPKDALQQILTHARRQNIATIFQSIEDPSNFEYFLPVAELFDHVFTSDSNCIERYRYELGHQRVYYGEYGANPVINNPIGSFKYDLPRALFSGSYPERYPERTLDMRTIFDSIHGQPETLTIIDRNFDTSEFKYPAKYQESIIGPIDHEKLQKVHKLFRYSINFNSIKDSPTMCAMRVYELQAQGKPLISNYARSVFNHFPEVRIIPHSTKITDPGKEQANILDIALAQRAVSRIMCQKTSYHVVADLFHSIGLKNFQENRPERVLVIALDNLGDVSDTVSRQKFVDATVITEQNFKDHNTNLDDYGYVAAMTSKREYGDYYLAGRIAAFVYTDSTFVSQGAIYTKVGLQTGPVHDYIEKARNRDLTVVSTQDPAAIEFMRGTTQEVSGRGYAVDPYEVDFKTYLRSENSRAKPSHSRLTIVIPVYNNGTYLLNKCLPSIQRHENWETLNILLVDDGSTDTETSLVCNDLASIFPNIRLIEYSDGGSGSASRPRNRGISEVSTEFITFLDPDNEISDNGYNVLLSHYDRLLTIGSDVDFVSGYQVKVTGESRVNGLHTDDSLRLVDNPIRQFFAEGRFPVVSSQAAVFKTKFLQENHIDFVEKAAGQDTLFGWEVLAQANQVAFTNETYIAYYAEREGSVTNEVNAQYFKKNLTLELEQVQRLNKLGLLDLYKLHHLEQFYRNWYLPRLALVDPSESPTARGFLSEIANLYGRKIEEFETLEPRKKDS